MADKLNGGTEIFAVRLYRRCLLLYPKAFRQEYGSQMAQLFCDLARDAVRKQRRWGLVQLWVHVLPDLVLTASLEHWQTRKKSMIGPIAERLHLTSQQTVGVMLAGLLVVVGVLQKILVDAVGGPPLVGACVQLGLNVVACVLVEVAVRSRGVILGLGLLLLVAVLLPLLWAPDATTWLRENPYFGGVLVAMGFYWRQAARSRWVFVLAVVVLSVIQIGISFR
jgi:hypothetical protein